MGRPRTQLQTLLESFIPSGSGGKVYFQPPNGTLMKYPAIVYKRDYRVTQHANNAAYLSTKRYQVTIIDRNPDSGIPELVAALPMCTFSRFFAVDNLNHDIYDLYF